MSLPVTYDDVLAAVPRVRAVLPPTPLYEWPGLSDRLGCRFFLKHENHLPVGAFKVRGGINLVGTLPQAEREAGILGCSTGNHGQSLAYAARRFGVRCTIVVPLGNNPGKNAAIRRLGAELIEHGRDFDDARDHCDELVGKRPGIRYVHSANEPLLIAGVGTLAWEIFEELPAPDVLLVPIGLGSSACGACLVAKSRRPSTRVIGVQAEGADAVAQSWRQRRMVETDSARTWAEGVATRRSAAMTLQILWELLDDVLLVSDEDLRRGVREILEETHNLAEGAGGAAYAAARRYADRFQGQTVVGVLSGGNLDVARLPWILGGVPVA